MKYSYCLLFFVAAAFVSCQQTSPRVSFQTEHIRVDSVTADAVRDMEYVEMMADTKAFMDAEMGIYLGYCADPLWLDTAECPMLNWTADVLLNKAKAICPFKVDISIQNGGGARAPWAVGKITLGSAFTLMPFNNRMVVLQLKGKYILELFDILAPSEHAHGIAGMRVAVKQKKVAEIEIDGQPIDPEATYGVATSNYLAKGRDHMTALTKNDSVWDSELLIRDIYIEAVREQDTVHAAVDGRWTIEK